MVKVSIITPVYNSAHLIERTINSVLKQHYKKWEMIIVDDGSSDNIATVIDEYARKDERIKFYRQENAGASAARNTGIKNASHDWLLFLDADDWIDEDYFEKMVSALESDPSIDVIHCGWTRISKNGAIAKENYGGDHDDMFPLLAHYCPFAIHSCIARKNKVEEVGLFDTSFKTCGDWDLWQRVARTGAKFKMIKAPMAFYNTTPNSLSSNGNQFCINGLNVISNAYTNDDRVPNPKPEYTNGLKTSDLASRKYYFITWAAGLLIGSLKPASHLLRHCEGCQAKELDPGTVAETLLDSVIIPAEHYNWINQWDATEQHIKNFLDDLEQQSLSKNLAKQSCAFIERHVITQSVQQIEQKQIGRSFAVKIEIEKIINDIHFYGDLERFFGIICLHQQILGFIELPIIDGTVNAALIKDAIATKFSWQILQHFFSRTIYPFLKLGKAIAKLQLSEQDLHDKIGWVIFLQQLWQKPGWKEPMFYDPASEKKENGFLVNANTEIQIEVSEPLPTVKTTAPAIKVDYYIGGMKAGTCSCDVRKNIIYPQMLRAAINENGAYELCRVAVREALIGQGIDNGLNLRERLKNSHRNLDDDRVISV